MGPYDRHNTDTKPIHFNNCTIPPGSVVGVPFYLVDKRPTLPMCFLESSFGWCHPHGASFSSLPPSSLDSVCLVA